MTLVKLVNFGAPAEREYIPFTVIPKPTIEKQLPEPYRRGVMTNKLWREETEGPEFAMTRSLAFYMTTESSEDHFFVFRVGYDAGFDIVNKMFGVGDTTGEMADLARE